MLTVESLFDAWSKVIRPLAVFLGRLSHPRKAFKTSLKDMVLVHNSSPSPRQLDVTNSRSTCFRNLLKLYMTITSLAFKQLSEEYDGTKKRATSDSAG